MEWKTAQWIRLSARQIREQHILLGEDHNHFVYAHLSVTLKDPQALTLLVSACSRYRLHINGKPVLSGPCRGDQYRQYYDEVDVSGYLHPGVNVFAFRILYCDWTRDDQLQPSGPSGASIVGICPPAAGHRLAVEGEVLERDGSRVSLATGTAPWKLFFEHGTSLHASPVNVNLGAVSEAVDFGSICTGWMEEGFDDASWWEPETVHPALPTDFETNFGQIPHFPLQERPIPLLTEEEMILTEELGSPAFGDSDTLVLPPGKQACITFLAPVLMSAYMDFSFSGGDGARVSFTYVERIMENGREVPVRSWSVSDLSSRGGEEFQQDTAVLSGGEVSYSPFWQRCFRIVQLHIENGSTPLAAFRPRCRRTHYPLEVMRRPARLLPWQEKLFDICVNTLVNCMMETYTDCPYYEQEQFIMDTRLQALFTYCISDDVRLAEKALEDFHCSMQPCGLIQGKYPSAYPQIISTFSLYYIFMIREFYEKTGRKDVLLRYRADCDRILEYFAARLAENGMVGNPGYWPFVDWRDEWPGGIPNDLLSEPSAVISLEYAMALKDAGFIFAKSGRPAMEEEYAARSRAVLTAVFRSCWDKDRLLLREGPGISRFSQHAQSFAVLLGIPGEFAGEDQEALAREMMRRAFSDPDVIRCSFAASYELFRALEKTGLRKEQEELLLQWKPLLERDVTTCPEVPEGGRSACHAWSALPILMLFSLQS